MHDRDVELSQVVRRAHAGEHQQLRVGNCAAAENDLIGLYDELFSAALDLYADYSLAVEQEPVRHAVGPDREVQPVSRLAEIAEVGAPAYAVRVVARDGPDAVGIGLVEVGDIRESQFYTAL